MIPSSLRLKEVFSHPPLFSKEGVSGPRGDIVSNEASRSPTPPTSSERAHPMRQSRALKSLIASRMAFGVAIWALPGPMGKAFGVDMTQDPLAIYLSRLMGARDVALAWELCVSEGRCPAKVAARLYGLRCRRYRGSDRRGARRPVEAHDGRASGGVAGTIGPRRARLAREIGRSGWPRRADRPLYERDDVRFDSGGGDVCWLAFPTIGCNTAASPVRLEQLIFMRSRSGYWIDFTGSAGARRSHRDFRVSCGG